MAKRFNSHATPVGLARLGCFFTAVFALVAVCARAAPTQPAADQVYLFTSFKEPADKGLRFLWSDDALKWRRVPGVFLAPRLGDSPIMRDPSIARGPDGVYHLVYTSAWRGDRGFGYASSKDLVHWSPQRFIPVMEHEETTVNVWAPEIFYEESTGEFVIAWASTIPGRYPRGVEEAQNNHRMYYTRTKDFERFSPAELFCEPGFSVIDAVVVPWGRNGGPAYKLVLKDNTRPVLGLRVAEGDTSTGPWRDISQPITGFKTEGPSVARVGDRWIIYYDSYQDRRYKALATTDFETFEDLADVVEFPEGHKHGTVLRVSRKELDYLLRVGREQKPGLGMPFRSPTPQSQIDARLAEIDRVAGDGPFQPDWQSLSRFQTPDWYADAKFGIFIHWGVYSVPAYGSEWYPRLMYEQGTREYQHHLENYGSHAEFGYKDFVPRFTAERFDPEEWADVIVASGARYVAPVAEHHDGFAMYHSDHTDWNAVERGPKRDVIGQLADACRQRGVTFGLSSHRAAHWWYFGPGRTFDSDVRDPANASLYGPAHNKRVSENQSEPPSKAFLDDWLLRSCELVDKYQPHLVYFDWWIAQPAFQPYLKRFAAYHYNRAAERGYQAAINFKEWEGESFPRGVGVLDVERGKFSEPQPFLWQSCTSVSKSSWGYVSNHRYKDVDQIVDDLVDIVSKNGVMLLNIGPKSDGAIPDEERRMLEGIGAWLRTNGDAIYATRPWDTYGEGPTKDAGGAFTDGRATQYSGRDLRFTRRGTTTYAIALAWPEDGTLRVESMGEGAGTVSSVKLLGADQQLSWRQTNDALVVQLPDTPPTQYAHAFAIEGL